MGVSPKSIWNLLKASVKAWIDDKAPRLGAALSFYTIFAIPPVFVIALFLASIVFNPEAVRSQMFSEVGGLIGQKSSEAIQSAMVAQSQSHKGTFAGIVAIVTLIVTATGLFIELQDALNTIWKVKTKPGHGLTGFVRNRVLSFAMIVGVAFLLLVSLVVSAALAGLSKYVNELLPGVGFLTVAANDILSFIVITVLFALIFKILPDVKIAWRDVWVGGATTSLLFTGGKFLLGWYLGRSTMVSAYGAAGSIILVLLWVYYSAQILFFGAEITKVYATRFGTRVRPASYARWVSECEDDVSTGARPKLESVRIRPTEPNRQAQLVSELREEVESLRHLLGR